jgi:hypothetical protein
MAVSTFEVTRAPHFSGSLLAEGFRLMQERLAVYLALAAACAATAWAVFPRIDMYSVLAYHPMSLVSTPPVSVVLLLAMLALFFILPSALRRIQPNFKMTVVRAGITIVTLASVGVLTDLGYTLAVIPGIVITVLLSQALIGALLRAREGASFREIGQAILGSYRGSVQMTKAHFATTLGVVVASLAILLVPFTLVLITLAVLGVQVPPSLIVMAPVLFLTFIYFECVRYALIVRWYRRLAEDRPTASP